MAASGAESSTLREEVPRTYILLDALVSTVHLSDKEAAFLDPEDQILVMCNMECCCRSSQVSGAIAQRLIWY